MGLRGFVCEKGAIELKIIHHSQGRISAFEIYQDWKAKVGQLQPRYSRNTPFLFYMTLVKHIKRFLDHFFSSLAMDHKHEFHLRSDVSPKECSRQGAALKVQHFTMKGEKKAQGLLDDDDDETLLSSFWTYSMLQASFSPNELRKQCQRRDQLPGLSHLDFGKYNYKPWYLK